MIFGRNNPSDPAQPKRRSMLRAVGRSFNPQLGMSIRPLGQAGRMFVELIAMILAANGLFPRNHPAFTSGSSAPPLKLGEVLATAWSGLSFTTQGMPKVLLFFAVVACLVFSALFIITFLLTIFVSSAHAQTGFFAPETQDLAQAWIDYLFKGRPVPDYVNQSGQLIPQSTGVQAALITALGFYSNAILIVAAFILFYHLVAMVVHTAHEGVPMGRKASQVWAPIRLVVAIGLLVPVAGGLNSGQYIVIKIAEWGSGLASQTWNVFSSALLGQNQINEAPPAPYVKSLVADALMMEACAMAVNVTLIGTAAEGGEGYLHFPSFKTQSDAQQFLIGPQRSETLIGEKITYTNAVPKERDLCGSYTIPDFRAQDDNATATQVAREIAAAHGRTFEAMNPRIREFAHKMMRYYQDGFPEFAKSPPVNTEFEDLVFEYQMQLQDAMTNAVVSANSTQDQFQSALRDMQQEGWVSAGAWFNTITRSVGTNVNAATDGMVVTTPPSLGTRDPIVVYLAGFKRWLVDGQGVPEPSVTGSGASDNRRKLDNAAIGFKVSAQQESGVINIIFAIIDWIAQWNRVWRTDVATDPNATSIMGIPWGGAKMPAPALPTGGNIPNPQASDFTLGIQFTSSNPFAEIAYLGHANLRTAHDLFDSVFALQAIAGALAAGGEAMQNVKDAVGERGFATASTLANAILKPGDKLLSGIATLISVIALVFFTAGFALAFVLPLVPFLHFFFNVLMWVASLFEAIVCVPLVALAHLNPEGEGLPGEKAKVAYFFIFNIFLRPVLMIFGLICGVLIFYVAASFMNKLYAIAVIGTGGLAHGHVFMSRFIYSALYVAILFACANESFKLIGWLPEHALKWMGAQALQAVPMDSTRQIESLATGIAGYAGQQLFKEAGSAARNYIPAAGIGGALAAANGGTATNPVTSLGEVTGGGGRLVRSVFPDLAPNPGGGTAPGGGPAGGGGTVTPNANQTIPGLNPDRNMGNQLPPPTPLTPEGGAGNGRPPSGSPTAGNAANNPPNNPGGGSTPTTR